MSSKPDLTDQQSRFCEEYLIDLNATQAAIRAGYSPKTAQEQGSRLLSNVMVQQKVQSLMDERSKRTKITSDDILKELLIIAKIDLANVYQSNGNMKSIHEIPEETRRAIAGIKVYEEFSGQGSARVKIGETTEVKFWDKPRALELLGKHLKLFSDRLDIKADVTGNLHTTLVDMIKKFEDEK